MTQSCSSKKKVYKWCPQCWAQRYACMMASCFVHVPLLVFQYYTLSLVLLAGPCCQRMPCNTMSLPVATPCKMLLFTCFAAFCYRNTMVTADCNTMAVTCRCGTLSMRRPLPIDPSPILLAQALCQDVAAHQSGSMPTKPLCQDLDDWLCGPTATLTGGQSVKQGWDL